MKLNSTLLFIVFLFIGNTNANFAITIDLPENIKIPERTQETSHQIIQDSTSTGKTDLELAKETLLSTDHTIVIVKEGKAVTSDKKGVMPLIDALTDGSMVLDGASVADRAIGKAAALLHIHGGTRELYTKIISKPAIEILTKHGISYQADLIVEEILNYNRTDLCPMEKLCAGINDPEDALVIISEFIENGFPVQQ